MTNDLNAVRSCWGRRSCIAPTRSVYGGGAVFSAAHLAEADAVALAPLPIGRMLVQYLGRRIHERFERIQAMFSDISAQAQENFSGARLIRAFAQEEAEIASFETVEPGVHPAQPAAGAADGMLWPTLEFVLGCRW